MSPSRGGARVWAIAAAKGGGSNRSSSSSSIVNAHRLHPLLLSSRVASAKSWAATPGHRPVCEFHACSKSPLSASLRYAQEEEESSLQQLQPGPSHLQRQTTLTSSSEAGLFEATTDEYDEFAHLLRQQNDLQGDFFNAATSSKTWQEEQHHYQQQQALKVLSHLAKTDIRAANRALRDFRVLHTRLASHVIAIDAAYDSLAIADIEAFHAWVELIPTASSLRALNAVEEAPVDNRQDVLKAQEDAQGLLKDVDRLLRRSVELSDMTPADVARTLISLLQKGFLNEKATQRTIGQVFAWVLRSKPNTSINAAGISQNGKGKEKESSNGATSWTWQFWMRIVDATRSSQLASPTPLNEQGTVDSNLARLYNRAIRTFALADNLDMALWWTSQSSSLLSLKEKMAEDGATVLQAFTLTLVAKRVFTDAPLRERKQKSDAMEELKSIQDKIYARAAEDIGQEERIAQKSNSEHLRNTLERQIGKLEQRTGLESPERKGKEGTKELDNLLLQHAYRFDIAGAWSLVDSRLSLRARRRRSGLSSVDDTLPNATTLAILLDMAATHAEELRSLEDETSLFEPPPNLIEPVVDSCLFRLQEGTRGGIGLVQTAEMLRLVNKGQDRAAIELFRTSFVQTADVQSWMRSVLGFSYSPRQLSTEDQGRNASTFRRLVWPGTHPKHILLCALVRLCENEVAKLTTLYDVFRDSLLDVNSENTPSVAESTPGTKALAQEGISVDEGNDISKILEGLTFGSSSNPLTTSHSFDLFLKHLTDALARPSASSHARGRSSSANYSFAERREFEKKVRQCRARANAKLLAILADMRRLQVEPSVATWTIVLQNLALGSSSSTFASRKRAKRLSDFRETGEGVEEAGAKESEGQKEEEGEVDEGAEISRERSEEKRKKEAVWKLARALQMDPDGSETRSRVDGNVEGSGNQTKTDVKSAPSLATATLATYLALMKGFLGVPVSQGGPLLEEARQVREWMLRVALQNERGASISDKKKNFDDAAQTDSHGSSEEDEDFDDNNNNIEAKVRALAQTVAEHEQVHKGQVHGTAPVFLLDEHQATRAPHSFTLDDIAKNRRARKTLAWLAAWESSEVSEDERDEQEPLRSSSGLGTREEGLHDRILKRGEEKFDAINPQLKN